jgi:hypothetical protein
LREYAEINGLPAAGTAALGRRLGWNSRTRMTPAAFAEALKRAKTERI